MPKISNNTPKSASWRWCVGWIFTCLYYKVAMDHLQFSILNNILNSFFQTCFESRSAWDRVGQNLWRRQDFSSMWNHLHQKPPQFSKNELVHNETSNSNLNPKLDIENHFPGSTHAFLASGEFDVRTKIHLIFFGFVSDQSPVDHINLVTSMLVTGVGDEMYWRQL